MIYYITDEDVRKNLDMKQCIDELRDNGINKMFIGTPYIKDRTLEETEYFMSNNFTVCGSDGLNKIYGLDISNTGENEVMELLNKNSGKIKEAGAIYLACTALPTYNVLNRIKMRYNIPVISENSAVLYKISKILNYNFFIPGIR